MQVKNRMIRAVSDKVWNKFAGYSKLNGLREAEFLELLLKLYEKQGEKECFAKDVIKK